MIVGRLIPAGTGAGMNRLRVAANSRDAALRVAAAQDGGGVDRGAELGARRACRRTGALAARCGGTGDDPLAAVVTSGTGTDADAGEYLNETE